MSAQLTRSYSANRKASRRFKLHVTSLDKRLLTRYETVLENQHQKWKGMTFSTEPYAVSDKDKTEEGDLIYLTADSDNTINSLDPGKTYIIGGIVDRNRHKNLCLNKADKQGIKHARLPIGDFIKMASRQVLTTNQVLEIMLEWLKEREWGEAFLKVIPQRKMPQARKEAEGRVVEGKETLGEGEQAEENVTKAAEGGECERIN